MDSKGGVRDTHPELEAPLAPRAGQLSATEMTEVVMPQHANRLGTAFGGTIMSWIDVCAAVVTQRHSGRMGVTVFVDDVEFLAPARVGDVVRLSGRVNAAFRTSMEVEVLVEREELGSRERTRCAEALLTFVCLDDEGEPTAVPPLLLQTEEELARAEAAAERRTARLARRAERPG